MKQIFVKLPNGQVELEHIQEIYERYKDTVFICRNWNPKAALIERKTGSKWLYVGQKFDSEYLELVEGGWTHDHCEFCFKTIAASSNESGNAYFNPNDDVWICKNCFQTFLFAPDIEVVLSSLLNQKK